MSKWGDAFTPNMVRVLVELLRAGEPLEYEDLERRAKASVNTYGELTRRRLIEYVLGIPSGFVGGNTGKYRLTDAGREAAGNCCE